MSSQMGGGSGGVGAKAAADTSAQKQQQQPQQPQQQQQHHHHHHPQNQRFSSLIHDSEVFLTKLREFKPQSLGCLEARRKSSSTLIFPSPQQACMGPPKCAQYPHDVKPTPGYWIECHGPGVLASSSTGAANMAVSASSAGAVSGSTSGHSGLPDEAEVGPEAELADVIIQDVLKRRQSTSDQPTLTSIGGVDSTLPQLKDGPQDKLTAGVPRVLPARSASELSQESMEAFAKHQPQAAESAGAQTTPAGQSGRDTGESGRAGVQSASVRRKLHKRTTTRDDIDLHKPRRAAPNITIAEPSFNESLGGAGERQPIGRQDSNAKAELARRDSAKAKAGAEQHQHQQHQTARPQRHSIRFQVQRYTSLEAQQQRDDEPSDRPREFAIEDGTNNEVNDDDTDERDDSVSPGSSVASSHQSQHHQLQYHRPSVICEDIDNENAAAQSPPMRLPQPSRAEAVTAMEQKKLYCGLSTTEFTRNRSRPAPSPPQQSQPAPPLQQHQQHQSHQQQQSFSEDQFRDSSLELISFEEENYEKHYYGREHWNYFTNDELLGPVMLSLKQEVNNQRDHFHVLLRTVSYTLHGTIPASTICADRYDREAIVRELSEIAKLKPPLMLGQLPSTPDELLKLDHIFIKTELKVGVIYIRSGQEESEEAILGNREESPLFTEFLELLGDRITLKGFDRYKGGLDTVHNLTGTESVYTMWRNIEIMFHVSTMLPHEENDPQKLQKKRHIGNDIVCVAFIESDDTLFWPGCIKSYFLHTFIAVRTSPKPVKEGEKRKYSVSCVCRNEVQYAFRPYLVEGDEFFKSDYFREWLLVKIVNGERASYSAPKFARMQDRTRSQLLEDIITNLANHLVTGQIPKPYRRGSWRPLGHTRASSPLEDSMKDYFEDYDQLAKDFCNAFCGPNKSVLCDVAFKVKDSEGNYKLVHGVRAIMAIRSRTFLEMLYGFVPPGTGSTGLQNQTTLRAIEMKALAGESSHMSGTSGKDLESTKSLLTKRGSVGADSTKKTGEKERRQSMLPNLSKNVAQKPNYLTVPNTGGGGGGGGAGVNAGGMIKNAFNRLVSGNWSGWSGNVKSYKGEPMHIKVDQNKTKVDLNSLAICKEIAKIDADKLTQREFEIKEFDYETFQQTIEYIHNGQCKLSYETIPGLICAAEHYDLPDLLHACFHHANTHMKLAAAPKMMNALYQNSCFYITAMQLLESIYEYIDPHGTEFFNRTEYLELYESVFSSLLCRKTLQVSELRKFQAMDGWVRQQVANKQQKQVLQRKQSTEQYQQQHQSYSGAEWVAPEQPEVKVMTREEAEQEYRNLMMRLNKEINIKLDRISSEDLVKIVLPTKVFSNDKIFEVMADESRNDY